MASSDLAKHTLKDMIIYFPTIILQGVISLIVAAILSKLFSPDRYGNYVLAFGIYILLTTLNGMWIHLSIIRLMPEYISKGQYNNLVVSLVAFEGIVLSFITLLAILIISQIHGMLNAELSHLLIVSLFGSVFMIGALAIESVYRITARSEKYSILVLIRILSGLAFGLILALYFQFEILGFFVGLVLPNFLIVIWHSWLKRKKWLNILKSGIFSKIALMDAFSYSLPFVGMNLFAMILGISDHYIIGAYLTVYEVGIYAISYLIANQGIQVLFNVIMMASDPIAIRTWEKSGPETAYDYLAKLVKLYTILVIPAWIGLFILGKELITLFSTSEYAIGAPIIGLAGFGILLHGFTQMLNRIFILTKKTMPPLINFSIISVINVVLNLLLIPIYGYIAAALSTFISYSLLLFLTIITTRRIVSFNWAGSYILKSFLSAAGMGIIVNLSKSFFISNILNVTIAILIGIISYAILMILLGGISRSEANKIRLRLRHIVLRS